MKAKKKRNIVHSSGPKPELLTIEGDWKDAVKRSFVKQKPPEGWPKPEPKKKQKS